MTDQLSVDDITVDEPGSSSAPEPGGPDGPKRRGRVKKRHTVARVVGVTVLVLAMGVGLTVVYAFRHLSGNLEVSDIEAQLSNRPEKAEVAGPQEPINILVMGSDTREGEGNAIDKEAASGASDTTILLHLSADRKRAYGISIPRDTMVDRPACNRGQIPAASYQQWNVAFALGGEACTIQQFEQITGIRIDHHVIVDFNGFQDMVDAVDGVEVCIPEEINDQAHGIHLAAGTREISGREALSYVRQRYAVGDGSDIGRMKRQQAFAASMANKVVSAGTLTSPWRLYNFLDAATKSLTVDPGLENLGKIAKLGIQFRDIDLGRVQFLTIPWSWDPQDPNRVVFAPEAQGVWDKVKNDEPLSRRLTAEAISAAQPPGASAGPSGSASGGPGAGEPSAGAGGGQGSQAAREAAEAAGLCT